MDAGFVVNSRLNIGVCYVDADMPLKFFVSVVRWDIRRARRMALEGLVVVAQEVRGFPPPDEMSRKKMVQEWAESAGEELHELARAAAVARIRLALVVPDAYIDCERIGVKVAAMHGLGACIVTTERDAVNWMAASEESSVRMASL